MSSLNIMQSDKLWVKNSEWLFDIREIKFDITWSYVKRQTAKMTSEFVIFSSNPSLNHIKIEKYLLLFATNTNIFTLLFKELETDGKSFIFAVCRLTYDYVYNVKLNLSIMPLKRFGICVHVNFRNRCCIHLYQTGWDENEKMRLPFGQAVTWGY